MGRTLMAALVALAAALVPAGAAQATHPMAPQGQVGGPPTTDFRSAPKPRTEPVLIATGSTALGPVEISAYDSRFGICITVDYFASGSGSCGDHTLRGAIDIHGSGHSGGKRGSSEIEGFVTPAAGTVLVRVKGRKKPVHAVLARPTPELLTHLRQDEPFAFFTAALRGCIPTVRMTAFAYDSTGLRLGKARGFRGIGDKRFCSGRPLPPEAF